MKELTEAKAAVAARKALAEKIYEEKLNALKEDPVFEEAYRNLARLKFEIARREVYGLERSDLEKEMAEKESFVKRFFSENGMGTGEGPEYFCKKCNDTGYVDGKKCDCLEKLRVEIALRNTPSLKEVPSSLASIDFDFYGKRRDTYKKYAAFLQKKFAEGGIRFCTVLGASGTGKTYLATTAAREALEKGLSVAVIKSVTLNKIFLNYHCAPLERKEGIWAAVADPDLLVVDDLGVESLLNNVTVQYLYELITERAEKKTLFTTNLDLKQLEDKYGQRIFSRLADKRLGAMILMEGEDYRLG